MDKTVLKPSGSRSTVGDVSATPIIIRTVATLLQNFHANIFGCSSRESRSKNVFRPVY